MIIFFGNDFSPFSRKVRLALEYKEIDYRFRDGLAKINHEALFTVNPRLEVPTIEHDGVVVSQSVHIVAYLDEVFSNNLIFPERPADRALARRIEHLFSTTIDAAIVNCSLWTWASRKDDRPEGLFEAAQKDINEALQELEEILKLQRGKYMFGVEPGVVEFTIWPHISALKPLGFKIDDNQFPHVLRWMDTMKEGILFRNDTAKTAEFLATMTDESHERIKIAWRGDRIEWMLARGYHQWLNREIEAERVIWPI